MNLKNAVELLKQTFAEFNEDKAPRLGAALAYYTVFALAPFLIVLTAIAGLVFRSDAQGKIVEQLQSQLGPQATEFVTTILDHAGKQSSSVPATIIGILVALAGAAGLFGQLQDALNTIWEVAPKPQGFLAMLKTRFLSFAMVLGTGFLLLVSLLLSAALQVLSKLASDWLPIPAPLIEGLNLLLAFGVITLLFALIFKELPDVEIGWSDVWIGAAVTSFLFGVGRFALSLYIGHVATTSPYGPAGSVVLVLLWVYYAAQILFFGAEFTQVYASKYGSRIKPSPNAVPVTGQARAQQGMAAPGAQNGSNGQAPDGSIAPQLSEAMADFAGVPHQNAAKNGAGKNGLPPLPSAGKLDRDYLLSLFLGFAGVLFLAGRRAGKARHTQVKRVRRRVGIEDRPQDED